MNVNVNVSLSLEDLRQIFLSLWLDITDPPWGPDKEKEEYRARLTELANRLEKVMSDNGLEIRRERKFYILCNGGGW